MPTPTSTLPVHRPPSAWVRMATGQRSARAFLEAWARDEVPLDLRDQQGRTLLHHLVMAGATAQPVFDAVLATLAQRQPSLLEARESKHQTSVLATAAEHGNLHAVTALLTLGANPHTGTLYSGAAIHLAAKGWHAAVVQALLDAGANPQHDNRNVTPLATALGVRAGTAGHAHRSPDLLATVNVLLAAGADPNGPGPAYPTQPVLHRAVGHDVAVVQRLLDAGADPNQRDQYQRTPLMEIVEPDTSSPAAQQAAADVRLAASLGGPTVDPTRANALAAWSLLLARGADLDAMDHEGRTALMLAVRHTNDAMVVALLDAGANPHATDRDGNNVLHLAADHGSTPALVQRLIDQRVSLAVPNHAGQTPLDVAHAHPFGPQASVLAVLEDAVLRHELDGTMPSTGPTDRPRSRL